MFKREVGKRYKRQIGREKGEEEEKRIKGGVSKMDERQPRVEDKEIFRFRISI